MTHKPLPTTALALQAILSRRGAEARTRVQYLELADMAHGARLLAQDPGLIMYLIEVERDAEDLSTKEAL